MASFKDLASISRDPDFQDRIRVALMSAATNVMTEVNTTPGHVLRVAYAGKVLSGQIDILDITIGVLDNATIGNEAIVSKTVNADYGIPDSDIQFAINSLFSSYSGVAN